MSGASLINIGELAKPATALIDKISGAVGILYEPTRIRNEAQAKAEAAVIEAESRIQVSELERRALKRFVEEQAKDQANIENITSKALPDILESSNPSGMDEDWIRHFFEKCKRVSDEEMQQIWASLLSNEANQPGSVSKRTVDFVASMDKSDAEIFSKVCNFSVNSLGQILIYDVKDPILESNGISWNKLAHLESIGLIKFDYLSGFLQRGFPESISIVIGNEVIGIQFKEGNEERSLTLGKVILTKTGTELRRFVEFNIPEGYYHHCVVNLAKDKRIVISSPFPRIKIHSEGIKGLWSAA